jgi:gliding motility-associated-like protein
VIPCRVPVIYIPNSFTPNRDDLNDTWRPVGSYVSSITVSVYNRWGGLVYKTDEMGFAWDGTIGGLDAPTGSYVYFIEFVTVKGVYDYRVGSLTIYR